MTSMSDFAGQPLTWVRRRKVWDLIASENSVIATFPVETSGGFGLGVAGKRFKKAKAIVPDGTGTLFLNEEGRDVAVYTVEQGPRLATYREPWLEFPDGRKFSWCRAGFFDSLKHLSYALKHLSYYGAGAWADAKGDIPYVVIRDGMSNHRVDIYQATAELRDPELSLLLVLGLYNIFVENRQNMFEGGPKTGLLGTGE